MPDATQDDVEVSGAERRCFVISAFGSDPDEQRRHKQVLRHLIRKVLSDRFRVVRADEIDDEGLITNQIIEHLIDDDLVVADLTGLNPNVFYEVAVRHAVRKPIVHLITRGQEIPFDVANMRAVPYALDDPDSLEAAQADLDRKVKAIEENDWKAAPNPISAARDVWLLQESEQPELREEGEILAAMGELRDEVRGLGRRVNQTNGVNLRKPRRGVSKSIVLAEVVENEPLPEVELLTKFPDLPHHELRRIVVELLEEKEIYQINGKLQVIPF